MIEWTSATLQGDEVMEWQDTEASPAQHHVYIGREPRGLPDISFHFETQEEAHALYLALCRCKRVHVERLAREGTIMKETNEAITLKQALESLDDTDKLNDGSDTWDKWNLLEQSDEETLARKVAVLPQGLYFVKDDGYLESLPAYTFE